MYDYLVVGSGLFGAVFAHEARKNGKSVLMLERRMVLCQDLKQIKMRIFHRKINICSLSCIYTII